MNDNRTISEILTDYEKTLNPDDEVTVSVGRRSITYNTANCTGDNLDRAIIDFLSSEEGQKLIPENNV
jgi:hypothetical protein